MRRGWGAHLLEFTVMDAKHTASERRQSFRDAGGQGTIVFDPTRLQQVAPSIFEPGSYADQAFPVRGQGGRGAAWFVRGEFGDGVLRHYRRGGWMARVSADRYLWHGEQQVRSIREFELLQRLHDLGLAVPTPIAAYYRRSAWGYRAAIVVERIVGVRSFAEIVAADGLLAPWAAAGTAIGRFHRVLAHHSDLNAQNILMDAHGVVYLIDWDKGRIESSLGEWCGRVLDRLRRSLLKECKTMPRGSIEAGMSQLREAHDHELAA